MRPLQRTRIHSTELLFITSLLRAMAEAKILSGATDVAQNKWYRLTLLPVELVTARISSPNVLICVSLSQL